MKIAVTHGGKIGDLLFSLPTARHIAKIFNTKIDFWTSKFCEPVLPLLKAQSYINDAFISQKFQMTHDQCGIQPWTIPIEGNYDRKYELGFREYPKCRLVDYFGTIYGFTMVDTTIKYNHPQNNGDRFDTIIVPGRNPALKGYFAQIMTELSRTQKVLQIGPKDECINLDNLSIVTYHSDMLETLSLMSTSNLFIGTLSANLVLANGFPNLKKVILVEPERHFPAHDIQSENHFYVEPMNALKECLNV